MKCSVRIAAIIYIIIESSISDGNPTDACHEYKKGDRYFLFPSDDDGEIHLINLEEKVNETSILFRSGREEKNVYNLYTRNNQETEQTLLIHDANSVINSYYDTEKTTVFLVHGWKSYGKDDMNVKLREAFLFNDDVNVISVDWSAAAGQCYITAMQLVPQVGKQLGKFIKWLTTLGASYKKIHLVGFSLGAHVVGNAGRETEAKVRRITALDPAGPLWYDNPYRIAMTDGKYVEVIHTNTFVYGYSEVCGHADFFPNGGSFMPGCILNTCSHRRAYEYMSRSLQNDMLANECMSMNEVYENKCSGTLYPMGNGDLSKSRSGIFRVNTETQCEACTQGNILSKVGIALYSIFGA